MKSKMLYLIFAINFVISANVFSEQHKVLLTDHCGKSVQVVLDDTGIVKSISGIVGNLSETKLSIFISEKSVNIHRTTSADGCFDIQLQLHNDFIEVTKSFVKSEHFKPRDNLSYNIFFDINDTSYLKDDFIDIRKDCNESIFSEPPKDSFLPHIKYDNGILYQHLGISMTGKASFKYNYSADKKEIICSKIMPGDNFEEFLSVTASTIKSENIGINVINYLILYCYNNQIGTMVFPLLFDLNESENVYLETEISADSYLTEGNVRYLPERLKIIDKGTPWVEGKKGDGIGSKITITAKSDISVLIISNGFDSEKKQIYLNNNRVKKIKITDLNNKEKILFSELPDSPNPVEIKLPFAAKQLEIEILSIYKGKKYEDTCLNFILAK